MSTKDIIAFIIGTLLAGIFAPPVGKWFNKWQREGKRKKQKKN